MKLKKINENWIILSLIFFNILSFSNIYIFRLNKNISVYLIVIFFFIILIKKNKNFFLYKDFMAYYFIIMLYLLSSTFNKNGLGSIINLLYFGVLVVYFREKKWTKNNFKFLFSVYLFINLMYIFKSFGLEEVYYKQILEQKITVINVNVISYLLLLSSMFIFILYMYLNQRVNKLRKKIIVVIFFLFNITAIVNLDSRGSLISIIFFIFFCLIKPKKNRIRNFFLKVLYIGSIIFSAVFPYIYIYMKEQNIIILVKGIQKNMFTGREIIWDYFFKTIVDIKKLIFGVGSQGHLDGLSFRVDLHNSTLGLITSFGLITTILFYVFVYRSIFSRKKVYINDLRYFSIVAYISTIILSTFEAIIYFSPIYINIILFISLANYFSKKDENIIIKIKKRRITE